MIRAGENDHRTGLVRRDMIVFEQRLKEAVLGFVVFKGHSVHFPRTLDSGPAKWIKEEDKVFLPVPDSKGNCLGVFVARGISGKPGNALVLWPALARMISDNLLLYKRSLCDPVTGLFTRHYLLSCLEREIENSRDPIRSAPPAAVTAIDPAAGAIARDAARGGTEGLIASGEETPRRTGIGTLVVRLAALRDVVREFGYLFADELMIALADALKGICPEQAVAARTGDSEFAVLMPAAGPKACRQLASEIAQTLRNVYIVHPLRREPVGIAASVGYTLYPQDMSGNIFVRPSLEQARLVLRKARLAAALADERIQHPGRIDKEPIMGFGRILSEGGRVLELLPLSRVIVSLGSNMHAREGQRFSVWSTNFPDSSNHGFSDSTERNALTPFYKGEIALMEVHENVSQAEIIHLGEPGWNIEAGDHLVLLPEEQGSAARGKEGEVRLDPATGLLRHGDFLAKWAAVRDESESFALALIRLAPKMRGYSGLDEGAAEQAGGEAAGDSAAGGLQNDEKTGAATFSGSSVSANLDKAYADDGDAAFSHPGQFMAEAVRLCLEELGAKTLGGRYGLNSIIFYHPDVKAEEIHTIYEKLAKELENRLNLDVAIGVTLHPFLDFRKTDALENCRKALEYAMLLPKPHVGLLDSLALNIRADKRFSQGDTFGAIKEYQLAILADDNNGMAWNSLGICLAGLGRHAEAERHFAKALESNPADAMALYNLGYMHQSQGQTLEAKTRYRECLSLEPDHLYAMIRLGQIAEQDGNTKSAREFYEKAAILPGGSSITYRHFARLCISENKLDEAREHLHEALLHDPQDALAMTLLARLYLDAGEDPDMAATLARQSVSLRPDLKTGWLQLARALDAMGKHKEATEARLKTV